MSTPQAETGVKAAAGNTRAIPFIDLNTIGRKRKYVERAVQTPEVIKQTNGKKPRLQANVEATPTGLNRAIFDSLPTTPQTGYNTSSSRNLSNFYPSPMNSSPHASPGPSKYNGKGLLSPERLLTQLSRKVLSPRTKISRRPVQTWQGAECFNMTYRIQFPTFHAPSGLDATLNGDPSEKQLRTIYEAITTNIESEKVEEETFETILETSDMLMDWDRAKDLETMIREDLKHGRRPELPRVGKAIIT